MNFQYFCVASCNNNAIFEGFSLICPESLGFLKITVIKVFATCLFMHLSLNTYFYKIMFFFLLPSRVGVSVYILSYERDSIFVYKLFLHGIFQIFLYLCKNCNPTSWKSLPPLSKQPPSENWDPLSKNWKRWGARLVNVVKHLPHKVFSLWHHH